MPPWQPPAVPCLNRKLQYFVNLCRTPLKKFRHYSVPPVASLQNCRVLLALGRSGVQLRAGPGALRTARCVCYAPPATVDPNQAAEAASYITSVVHDDDCIPRMSILSLLELYKSLVSYNWLPRATGLVGKMRADPQQAWFLELGDNAFRKTLEEQLESIWKEQAGQLVEEVKKLEKPRQEAHPLSIPGFIVHLYRLGKLILSRQAQQVAKF